MMPGHLDEAEERDGRRWTSRTVPHESRAPAVAAQAATRAAAPSHNYDRDPRYASFGQRLGAYLLDSLILLVGLFIIGSVLGVMFYDMNVEAFEAFSTLIGYAAAFGYFITMEGSSSGATLGKRAAGIRVIATDGTVAGYGKASGRTFAKILSGLPLGLGYLWSTWDDRGQTWHDKLASTVVVRTNEFIASRASPEREPGPSHPLEGGNKPRAGWYPDPESPELMRYWNGREWRGKRERGWKDDIELMY